MVLLICLQSFSTRTESRTEVSFFLGLSEPDFFEPKIPADYIKPEERGLIGINLKNWPTAKVVSGMAAEKAGVKDGDVVLKVNGNSISHIKSSGDALNLLSGKAGDKVVLTVKRGEQILAFEIERVPSPK